MPSKRVQRQIDRLLTEAEAALADGAWDIARRRAEGVLSLDLANEDGKARSGGARGAAPDGSTGD